MSLKANKSRLTGLTKDILLRWADTQKYWRDAKGAEFDRRFMQRAVSAGEPGDRRPGETGRAFE